VFFFFSQIPLPCRSLDLGVFLGGCGSDPRFALLPLENDSLLFPHSPSPQVRCVRQFLHASVRNSLFAPTDVFYSVCSHADRHLPGDFSLFFPLMSANRFLSWGWLGGVGGGGGGGVGGLVVVVGWWGGSFLSSFLRSPRPLSPFSTQELLGPRRSCGFTRGMDGPLP